MPHRPRLQVRDPNRGPATITPQARPVDTFEAPRIRRSDPNTLLAGLAEGLSTIAPQVQRFAQENQRRSAALTQEVSEAAEAEAEAAREEGAALYRRTRVAAADAVRRGLLPAGENPFLHEGYRRAELRTAGMVSGQTLQTSWAQSDVRNSDDPQDYQDFVTEFTQEALAQFGPEYTESDILAGFIPEYDRALNVVQQQHTAFRVQANEQRAIQASGTLMTTLLGAHIQQPVDTDSPEAARIRTTTAASLGEVGRELIGTGIPGREVNRLIADSLISQAETTGRLDLLDIAGSIRTGSGVLSGIPELSSRFQAARVRIENLNRSREEYARNAVERQRVEYTDRLQGRAVTEIFESGGEPTEAFIGMRNLALRLAREPGGDPDLPVKLNRIQKLLAREEVAVNEDAVDVALLQSQLADPNTTNGWDIIIDATLQGRLTSGTVRSLGQFYARRTSGSNRSVFGSTVYTSNERDMVRIIQGGDQFNRFGTARRQILATQARSMLGGIMSRLIAENPDLAADTAPGSEFELAVTREVGQLIQNPIFNIGERALEAGDELSANREQFQEVRLANTSAELLRIQEVAARELGSMAAFLDSPLREQLERRWDELFAENPNF